jgi:hypothetical protein
MRPAESAKTDSARGFFRLPQESGYTSADIDTHTKTSLIRLHHARLNPDNSLAQPDEIFRMDDEPGHDELCQSEQQFLLRAIREDLDLTDHMRDAVNSLRIVLAANESVRSGRVVDL